MHLGIPKNSVKAINTASLQNEDQCKLSSLVYEIYLSACGINLVNAY